MDRERLVLWRGAFELHLTPRFWGVPSAPFATTGRDIMRPATAAFLNGGDPLFASCFPLVPFSNRIADARFRFRGTTYEVPRNFPPEPHAIHGQGWQKPWQVVEAGPTRAALAFRHTVLDTPLDYRARQVFELGDNELTVMIEVTNAGAGPMPAGIGLHAYFVRTKGVTLRGKVDHVWLADQRKIPEERVPVPAKWDLANAPRIATLEMDNCFDGWDGQAKIHWPENSLTLWIDAEPVFGHLVVYIPQDEDFFCVEPVSTSTTVSICSIEALPARASMCWRRASD